MSVTLNPLDRTSLLSTFGTLGVFLALFAETGLIPNVDRYLLPVIALIVVVSLVPVGLELVRARRAR